MRALDLLQPALRQFRAQRLQALLISVAIALGVGVVVAVAALTETGNELNASLRDSLMGREIKVRSSASPSRRLSDDTFAAARRVGLVGEEPVTLGLEDLEAARDALPEIPYLYFEQSTLLQLGSDQGRPDLAPASRVTAEYFSAAGLKLLSGSFFAAADYEGDGNVMLVTPRFVEELGLSGDPVGQSVELEYDGVLRIVGMVEELSGLLGAENHAYLPLTPDHMGWDPGLELTAAVADAEELNAARSQVEEFARGRWGQRAVVENALPQAGGTDTTLLLLVAGFASLGLLVAALNIMNLMLARVLKRQRDIGILRSLGASRRAVATQVLLEALLLGALGGLLGIAAGYGLLAAYDAYLRSLAGGVQVVASPGLRLGASASGVGVALAVSLVFGVYPAIVATRVRPMTALRSL